MDLMNVVKEHFKQENDFPLFVQETQLPYTTRLRK